jgi:hypothetical protein
MKQSTALQLAALNAPVATRRTFSRMKGCRVSLTIALEPLVRLRERLGFDPARTPLGIPSPRNQPGALQDLEVLRDRGLAHLERSCEFGNRRFAVRQPGKNRAAGRIGERGESGVEVLAWSHFITNKLYNCLIME